MPSARSPCSKSITDKRMRRICSFTDFYSVLLDFLRLSGAMILTDYLLLESIQHRIGANKIRVRFTTEFFFEHGFIGLTRMFRSWRYCLPDSSHYMSWKSRDFVPGYSRCARYWLPAKSTIYATKQPKTDTYFLYFYLLIFFHPFNPYNPCSFHH